MKIPEMEGWITTRSGKHFYPLNPRPEDIDLADIGHALGNLCRFTGHASRFYSVAEHSVRASWEPVSLSHARQALMHDASEAYINDLSRPLKHLPELAEYRVIEKRIQTAIYERFDIEPVEGPWLKELDWRLVVTEGKALLPDLVGWHSTDVEPVAFVGFGWAPESAARTFLGCAATLGISNG